MNPDPQLIRQAWQGGEHLMVADWMETIRPGWAELIRLESATDSKAIETPELIRHRRKLIANQEKANGSWTRCLFDWDWVNGIVEQLESTVRGWQRLISERPLDPVLSCWIDGRIRLGPGEENAAAEILSHFPHWSKLTLLSRARFNVEQFLHHPATHRLTHLDLSGIEIEGGAIRGMENSGLLEHLQALDLSQCPTVGDKAMRELAQIGSTSLEELDLRGSNLTRGGLAALLESRHLPKLRVLRVDLFDQEKAGLFRGPELRRAFEDSPLWQTLEEIDLNGIHLQPHEWEALADLPHWKQLKRVGLARTVAGPRFLGKLIQSENLESLDLACNRLHGGSFLEWTAAGKPPRLQSLRLDENPIGDKALLSLAKTGWLTGLRRLEARSMELGKPGLTRLAKAIADQRVEYFAAGGNFLGDVSLPALLDSLGQVDELDLGGTPIDEPMARILKDRFPSRIHTLVLGPVALGLELSHTWKDPWTLCDLDVLGVFRVRASELPDTQPPDTSDLNRLITNWPEPGLVRIVNETGTLARRRPGKPKTTTKA